MWKFISFFLELFIVGYSIYLMFKVDPSMRDLVWLGSMAVINTVINQSKLERIEKKLNG